MLNLYAVTVWHSSEPSHYETIGVRTYTASRAQHLARESFPGCRVIAEPTRFDRIIPAHPLFAADCTTVTAERERGPKMA